MRINISSFYYSVQKYWFILFLIFLLIITTMSLSQTRLHTQNGISFYDKIYHFLLYSLWSFPVFIANHKSVKFFFIFMILYGGLIEVIQPYFGRSCEIEDFIANTLGVLFSYFICLIANSK